MKGIEIYRASEEEEWDEGGAHYVCVNKGDIVILFYLAELDEEAELLFQVIKPVVLNDYLAIKVSNPHRNT